MRDTLSVMSAGGRERRVLFGTVIMVAFEDIEGAVQRIVHEFRPERVILFGSHAQGQPRVDSDVDLLVIMPFQGKPFWKSLDILNRIDPAFPMDLMARTPEDTRRRYDQGDPLIRDALDHGRVLYERDR